MENYNDLLLAIEKIKNEPDAPFRSEGLYAVKQLVNTFADYVRTVKSQIRKDPSFGMYNNSFTSFFGSNDLEVHEMKLKELRKKLREISAKDKTA